ncbi:zinc finger protein 467 [Boleophthalmus pectinirostris]|uniref:zinc finger protein 467 n=1 Tax=Boleophthalmus pectinirostris TaxID=150288 RepID=UPI00242F2683|nr:zinc finger protein 467 [Boleophthalmus pectinirostris]
MKNKNSASYCEKVRLPVVARDTEEETVRRPWTVRQRHTHRTRTLTPELRDRLRLSAVSSPPPVRCSWASGVLGMSGYEEFRSQLASIMAAVAEMCELLDEKYGALQLELSRSHRENEALRNKLQLIESIVARGGHRGHVLVYGGEEERDGGDPRLDPSTEALTAPEQGAKGKRSGSAVSPPDTTTHGCSPRAAEGTLHFSVRLTATERTEWKEETQGTQGTEWKEETEDTQEADSADVVLIKEEDTEEEGDSPAAPDQPLSSHTESEESAAGPSGLHCESVESSPPGGAVHTVIDLTPEGAHKPFTLNPAPDLPAATDTAPRDTWTNRSVRCVPAVQRLERDLNAFPFIGLSASQLDVVRLSGERRFVCTYCGKGFSSARGLETHIRVHTGERPFGCAQCGKRFTQSGHLKTHQSVHTGHRPFACLLCGKRFAGKQNLRIHQQKHHPNEPQAP